MLKQRLYNARSTNRVERDVDHNPMVDAPLNYCQNDTVKQKYLFIYTIKSYFDINNKY